MGVVGAACVWEIMLSKFLSLGIQGTMKEIETVSRFHSLQSGTLER